MSTASPLSWYFHTLALACRVRKSYVRARRIGLPGQAFYSLGRSLGWRLFRMGNSEARALLMAPVSITRYFEFDFAWRALADNPGSLQRCLDVSSPFLFSFAVTRFFPEARVRMMNPSAADSAHVRKLIGRLLWPGIECVQSGVESLDREDGTYNTIWSLSVVEHIAGEQGDDRDAVCRMWKVLRPGGYLILTVPTDKRAGDEYRDNDPYGTQPKCGVDGTYFFQRFYDEAAIRSRIIESLGREPMCIEWFGEKEPGHFHAYIGRWRREGAKVTVDDPFDIAQNYQTYPSFEDMPGAGVCGLLFIKQ